MQPHQQRVVDEQLELGSKLQKLLEFLDTDIYRSLTLQERNLLTLQSMAMLTYDEVLLQRIANF
jgi:hypothetical protein